VADIRSGRSTLFCSDALYDAVALKAIMRQVIPDGYNEFDPFFAVKGLVAEYDDVTCAINRRGRKASVCTFTL